MAKEVIPTRHFGGTVLNLRKLIVDVAFVVAVVAVVVQQRGLTLCMHMFYSRDLAAFKVITIYVTHAKGRKKISFGRTDIPIRKSEECEGWYPILQVNERTRSKEWVGDLRLRLKCEEQIVLPIGNYSEVLEASIPLRNSEFLHKVLREMMLVLTLLS